MEVKEINRKLGLFLIIVLVGFAGIYSLYDAILRGDWTLFFNIEQTILLGFPFTQIALVLATILIYKLAKESKEASRKEDKPLAS